MSNWNGKLINSNLFKVCVICGSSDHVQMHYVRKTNDLKAKKNKMDLFSIYMAAINRKQVPLCSTHYVALQNNTLSASDRELFKNNLKVLK